MIYDAIDDQLAHIPEPLRTERITHGLAYTVQAASDHEQATSRGRPTLPFTVFTNHLIDGVVGLLEALVSPATRTALRAAPRRSSADHRTSETGCGLDVSRITRGFFMRFDFDGSVAIVTGGGSGIGRASALSFARRGAQIVVADLDAERAATVADEIGNCSLAVRCDVTDLGDLEAVRDQTLERFGRVDLVMNNVGVLAVGPAEAIPSRVGSGSSTSTC